MSPGMEDDIFSAIVSMCTKRILLRLRLSQSKRNRNTPKQIIQQALRSVIECLVKPRIKNSDHRYKLSSSFIEQARIVISRRLCQPSDDTTA
jgi:hypothetical protein